MGTRSKTAFLSGTITDNPLAVGGTTLNSAGLASLPAIVAPQIAVLVLDPTGSAGAPEVIWVTAHTGSATSATISRGKEGSSAREHASGISWAHGPTIIDIEEDFSETLERVIKAATSYNRSIGWLGPAAISGSLNSGGLSFPIGLGFYLPNGSANNYVSSGSGKWTIVSTTADSYIAGRNFVVTEDITFVCRVTITSQANQVIFIGGAAVIGAADANDRIGFRIAGTGNIIAFCDNGGTETTRDSGAAPTGTQVLKIVISAGGTIVRFYIDDVQVGADVTTNIYASTLLLIMDFDSSSGLLSMDVHDAAYWED